MKHCQRRTDVFERLGNYVRDNAVKGDSEGALDDDQRAVVQHHAEAEFD